MQHGEHLADRPLALEHAGPDAHQTGPAGAGGRWVEARDLALGDQRLAHHQPSATIIGLQVRTERLKVYNLTILRLRNDAVGKAGVSAHNNHPCTGVVDLTIAGFKQSTDPGLNRFVLRLQREGIEVQGVNIGIHKIAGDAFAEVDVITKNAIIEYKDGVAGVRGVIDQAEKLESVTTRPVIVFINAARKKGNNKVLDAGAQGIVVTNDFNLLVSLIK